MPETTLQLILHANVNKGQADALRELARTLPPQLQKSEPGTQEYVWSLDPTGTHACFIDVYASSEAFVTHFEAAQSSGALDKIMAVVDFTTVTVVGAPSPAARKILDGFGAQYFTQIGGFNRLRVAVASAR